VRPHPLDEFLKNAHIPFTPLHHPPAFSAERGAALCHVPGRSWAKTVICLAGDEPVAAVVPAHLRVDLEQLRTLAGAVTMRLAREEEIAGICPGCEPGAVSLFTGRWQPRVFVDQSFVGDPGMVFGAGTHTEEVQLHYGDFAELTRPVVGSIAIAAGAAGVVGV
jgi:Ala-tRNA(Pro) deacylase